MREFWRECLGCHEFLPLALFAYHQTCLICDECRWSGRSQDPDVRREMKVIHERNRRQRLRQAA